jgi:hypothetical protein
MAEEKNDRRVYEQFCSDMAPTTENTSKTPIKLNARIEETT